jgi:HAE1 family hydrophobic/amphiphilic exporter-1
LFAGQTPSPAPPRPTPGVPAQSESEKLANQAIPPVRVFELPKRVGIFNEVSLTLNEALLSALGHNQDLEAARIDQEETGYRLRGARGVYDPVFNALGYFEKQTIPVTSSLNGSNSGSVLNRIWDATPSLSGSVPKFGGSYSVDFSSQKYTTNNLYTLFNPNYPSAVDFSYTQPLWRNLRYDSNRYTIEVARKNRELSSAQFRQSVIQIVERTERAYWELVFARRDLDVQLEALEVAHQQDESNRRQVESGALAPIEVVAAQTQLANFEINVYSAQDALTRAENRLKSLMLGDRTAALWGSALNPTTLSETDLPSLSLDDAMKDALVLRPETEEMKIEADINTSGQRLNREELKPQVDLIGSYTLAGLAGTLNPASSSNPLDNSLTPALLRLNQLSAAAGLNNLISRDFPTWMLQLRVSVPIGNHAIRSQLAVSVAEGKRLDHQKLALEQNIQAEVRDALQGVFSAQQRLESARIKRQYAEQQYQSEERQFRRGLSSLFLVQQRQLTAVTSMSQAHRAEADLSEAISQFELACGSNYKRHNISIK